MNRRYWLLIVAVVTALCVPTGPQVSCAQDAGGFSDRLVIDASFSEDAILPETASFTAFYPNDPNLKPGDVYFSEFNNDRLASDLVSLDVTRLTDANNNIIAMQPTIHFTSAPNPDPPLPNPLPANTAVVPETGNLQDLTKIGFPFGANLPFTLGVSSDLQATSLEPSDRMLIDASLKDFNLPDGTELAQLAQFQAIYHNDPNLHAGSFYLVEPGVRDIASDRVDLDVVRLLDAQGNIVGMRVTLTVVSIDQALPPGAVSVLEDGNLQDLTKRVDVWGAPLPFQASLASAVPEPGTVVLLAIGVLLAGPAMLCGRARRLRLRGGATHSGSVEGRRIV